MKTNNIDKYSAEFFDSQFRKQIMANNLDKDFSNSNGRLVLSKSTDDSLTFGNQPNKQKVINIGRAFAAEFIGTAMFVFIGSLSSAGKTYGAFGHGFAIVFLAFAFGRISGGHFNPAVTIGHTVCCNTKPLIAIFYIFFQLLGGFVGALCLRAVTSPGGCPISYTHTQPCNTTQDFIAGGCAIPQSLWYESLICEFLLTFILMQIILCTDSDTQDDKERNLFAPIAIGFTIFANILAGARISGGIMNPARAFGPAAAYSIFVPTAHKQWTYMYIYWAGPIPGAIVAAVVYK